MLVDGKKIASDIAEELKTELLTSPRLKLLVIQVGSDPASESFIMMKKAFADKVGVEVAIEKFPEFVTPADLISRVKHANTDKSISGMIVQLPLPAGINTKEVLDAISPDKDPDLLSADSKALFALGTSKILPPVVGEPVTVWFKNLGVDYALVTAETSDKAKAKIIKTAELLITGAGDPGMIKPEMIQEGVVIVDVGTSESGGMIKGDVDPTCQTKASLITPVPGGVGPVAVAQLFKNLVELAQPTTG